MCRLLLTIVEGRDSGNELSSTVYRMNVLYVKLIVCLTGHVGLSLLLSALLTQCSFGLVFVHQDHAVSMMWKELVRICSGGGGSRMKANDDDSSNSGSSRSRDENDAVSNNTTDKNNKENQVNSDLKQELVESRRTSARGHYFPAASPDTQLIF